MRTTMNAVPNAPALLEKSKIPLGLIVSPFHQPVPGEAPIPLINPPSIPRCSRCTAYLNPWIKFVNGGSQWRCSICGVENPVPQFFDWDANSQTRVDRLQRSELTHAIVEYQASQDYMARPPQPVVIIFVIDVSYAAVQSGLVFVAAKTILESLDRIPNLDGRTKVAFLTVDGSVHFYNIGSHLAEPEMLVVSDLDDTPYLPRPDDLLVPLAESRPIIEKLLSNLSNMFKSTLSTKNALPRALASAFKLIEKIGGKIVVVQSSLPNVGPGSLESREDPKLLGTPKESGLLQPAILHYKQIGNDFAKAQVSIDLFCAPAQYGDFTTLSGCVRYSGGSAFLYPGFNASSPEDAAKLSTELGNHLALHNGLEAVCRVRVSTGLAVAALHGNFHKSQFDLISLPNVNPTHSFAVQLLMPEALKDDIVCFQAGLLYTTTEGERRIRVITLAVAVTPQLDRVFGEADHIAIAALTVKKGVQHSQLNSNGFAREGCVTNLNGIAGAYKQHATSQGQSSQLLLPENLSLLPALSLGMLKHIAFRTNSIVPTDVRSYARAVLYAASTEFCITALHPRLWALTADAGASSQAELREFPLLNLRAEQVASAGLCLLDNGLDVFLWVGRNVPPQLCAMLFGKGYEGVQYGKLALPVIPNEFNQRVNDFVRKTREHTLQTAAVWPNFYIVKEDSDPSLRMSFLSHLFEDRTESNSSYVQFLGEIREKVPLLPVDSFFYLLLTDRAASNQILLRHRYQRAV
ncbi:hypothetical protein DFJ73DRAFT_944784 [Zopfochytrium polystomum]|nr:hypothetical protein DFJ73DRAFT_944784 [Zopfochytrium polystomum]